MRRAFTLIELMVAVSILGIFAALAGSLTIPLSRSSADIALRERARQVLEYEADAMIHGRSSDPNIRRALLADLPRSHVITTTRGAGTAVAVTWKSASGEGQYLELVVMEGRR